MDGHEPSGGTQPETLLASSARPKIATGIALILGLFQWGLRLIGVNVNLFLGGIVLLVVFCLLIYSFWIWEKPLRFHVALRILTVVVAGLLYFGVIGKQMLSEYRQKQTNKNAMATPLPIQSTAESQRNGTMPLPAPTQGVIKGSEIKRTGELNRVTIAPIPPPIEVSLNCYPDTLPITVPVGSVAFIAALNRAANVRPNFSLREIINTNGDAPKIWPDEWMIEADREKGGGGINIYRCDVTNHGKDDLIDLSIPLRTRYFDRQEWYLNNVVFGILDQGKSVSFHVINDCPVETQTLVPETATAQVVGESQSRQFQIELTHPHMHESFQLNPSSVSWTQMTCQ